ncbi:hypothetical protein A2631_00655 [Candidatus Daviesbacteria bacterium RIFCSPHIGHO2_01_FULL_44_29]|uniref:ATP synthase F1 complex delta/epsilon subunit N-terminal domain-containing protein n=1 Tax=Candidatus Daviesbacteria bacterium RIFCSPHIGHO2_02_FULL_43_12 TaxID=1797776 RepID=A0A1F5KHA1_9BACT|nr:MAG: hypothetical protein A2631_00655 [Candidatus Daviesbacteria bacterium RIFCSPHIGHO2_01_FULL_44_29]OGE39425.1 MAG: hypothetical protein A3E86_01385 [Candidatus Daviesbacteria bacterium RIFCSPHIGHO2_12_FULL_47_45]OGE40326.1 MAG: hypothetical protein A3D25_03005 [Candidatus Daviesbacteria bacterium RIFCSPHIGHO2_02_FULL_43_12]OGE69756.1 MAG: hypothetical protein A3B55_02200 [Candidatus Daviesbacteria bacterium RIFCSPLOWO2_01_FULL_43_15]
MEEFINVKVMSPHKILFEGKALAVSSVNTDGKFDILPEHANFITLVENQVIQITKEDKQPISFTFTQALIYNESNKVSIYAEPLSL